MVKGGEAGVVCLWRVSGQAARLLPPTAGLFLLFAMASPFTFGFESWPPQAANGTPEIAGSRVTTASGQDQQTTAQPPLIPARVKASSPSSPGSPEPPFNDPMVQPVAKPATASPSLTIPRIDRGPSLDDFLSMQPVGDIAHQMAKVTGFKQRNPHDGQDVSEPTEAYLGYDQKNLYVVFVCFDDPGKVRARKSRREDVTDDDTVEIMLDTFHDRRRAYAFQINPLGVQWDAIWSETPHEEVGGNFDTSWDTVWYSQGRLTPEGYVAWIEIPFRSMRFPSAKEQSWGLILYRGIVRENEDAFWPQISQRFEGRLAQAATLAGLEGISPGRNLQFIPYGLLNSFRDIDAH